MCSLLKSPKRNQLFNTYAYLSFPCRQRFPKSSVSLNKLGFNAWLLMVYKSHVQTVQSLHTNTHICVMLVCKLIQVTDYCEPSIKLSPITNYEIKRRIIESVWKLNNYYCHNTIVVEATVVPIFDRCMA